MHKVPRRPARRRAVDNKPALGGGFLPGAACWVTGAGIGKILIGSAIDLVVPSRCLGQLTVAKT